MVEVSGIPAPDTSTLTEKETELMNEQVKGPSSERPHPAHKHMLEEKRSE